MLSLDALNQLSYWEFRDQFGSVIEHCPFVAAAVWSYSPFISRAALHTAFVTSLTGLSEDAKVGVLRCHPDLAGKLADHNQLSAESTKEQQSAGLSDMTAEEKVSLTSLNEAYKQKYRFPFVLCARENKKECIFRELRARLPNSIESEIENGLKEVCKIAWHRLTDLVVADDTSNL